MYRLYKSGALTKSHEPPSANGDSKSECKRSVLQNCDNTVGMVDLLTHLSIELYTLQINVYPIKRVPNATERIWTQMNAVQYICVRILSEGNWMHSKKSGVPCQKNSAVFWELVKFWRKKNSAENLGELQLDFKWILFPKFTWNSAEFQLNFR